MLRNRTKEKQFIFWLKTLQGFLPFQIVGENPAWEMKVWNKIYSFSAIITIKQTYFLVKLLCLFFRKTLQGLSPI